MESADALILGTPEWQGMATPQAKNFFLLSSSQQLGHKPGLLVSVSAGRGGAYPIAELRASSYKNTRIVWMPEHLIVRDVPSVLNRDAPESPDDEWIRDRIDYALTHLIHYASALSTIRDQLPRDARFSNGM
jgi:NAD(P)H-dependent FMN reductase